MEAVGIMDDLTATALYSMIHEQCEAWKTQDGTVSMIKKSLLQGCTEECSRDEIYAKMAINAVEIAACISAKVILEMLLTAEVIKPKDEEQLRRTMLSVVK